MTARFARDLVDTVQTLPVDAILCDSLPGMLLGGQATGLPTAVLLANVYLRPTAGLPLLGTGWSPGEGRLRRARDRLAPAVVSWLLTATLPRLNAVAGTYGQPPLADLFELFEPVPAGPSDDQSLIRLLRATPSSQRPLRRPSTR
jgi:hypothetical protein